MTRPLLILLVTASIVWTLAGCKARPTQPALGPVPANRFVKNWGANLELSRDVADRLFLREELLVLYTRSNRAYVFSATGGQLLAMNQVTSPNSTLRPPVLVGDKVVYPTLSSLEVYDRRSGRHVASISLDRATRSPAAAHGNILYFGADYHNGGRLVKYDVTRAYARTMWELITFSAVSASPVVYEDIIYAATENGRTYAVTANRDPVWPIEGNTFLTAGRVVADLKADDYGLYVASMDSRLYCLDRTTGRIRWSYFAGAPLREPPVVVGDRVYQYVPRRGLVALHKTEGQLMRDPLWNAPNARQFLSTDEVNVYVLATNGSIVALDRATGEPKFRSQRRDLTVTDANTRDATIYAASRSGQVLSIRPVLRAGTVGELVFEEQILSQPLALGAGE